jgi:hypothetical protein
MSWEGWSLCCLSTHNLAQAGAQKILSKWQASHCNTQAVDMVEFHWFRCFCFHVSQTNKTSVQFLHQLNLNFLISLFFLKEKKRTGCKFRDLSPMFHLSLTCFAETDFFVPWLFHLPDKDDKPYLIRILWKQGRDMKERISNLNRMAHKKSTRFTLLFYVDMNILAKCKHKCKHHDEES